MQCNELPRRLVLKLMKDIVVNMKRGILLKAESRLERVSHIGFSVSAL
jgi:hypothetical protein